MIQVKYGIILKRYMQKYTSMFH